MLDQLADEVKSTIQELRELAHGIYPPLLVDSGLGEALRAAANRSPLPVSRDRRRTSAATRPRSRRPSTSAAWRRCRTRPSTRRGASVEVRLWEESGGLLFSVSDDGPGFDPARRAAGHGFVNMADRLGAIGGTVRWESEPGQGAQVRGSIPLL